MTTRRFTACIVAAATATALAIAPANAQSAESADLSADTIGSLNENVDKVTEIATSSEAFHDVQGSIAEGLGKFVDDNNVFSSLDKLNAPLFGGNNAAATDLSVDSLYLSAILLPFTAIAVAVAAAVAAAANFAGQR